MARVAGQRRGNASVVRSEVSTINSPAERHRTQETCVTRTMRVRKEEAVDEAEATKQLIRMVVMERRGKKALIPVTIASIKWMKKLVGIEALETKEGKIYWRYPDAMKINLENSGIDSETGIVVDEEKFRISMKRIAQEEAARLEEKYEVSDNKSRREALRAALQRWRPVARPVVASVEHYMANQVLNTRIARELRGKIEE